MKHIKIKFSGMTGRFDPENNFISDILKKRFIVELSDQPDYLFYTIESKDYLNYDCIRIFFTVENLVPDFNICDYGIGFSRIDFGDRYFRYPLFLVDGFIAYQNDDYNNDLQLAQTKHLRADEYIKEKSSFCSFVYSNSLGAKCREQIFYALSEYKRVDSGGRYMNNIGESIESKLKFQSKSKFVIAFENTSTPGYTTEKIIGAYAAGAIPIYWGDPDIESVFNQNSFINCNKYGLTAYGTNQQAIDEIVDVIKKIDSDDLLYEKYLKTPAFIDSDYSKKKQENFEKFLFNIFEQDKEKAYRRNRYYWGERYERKQKIGNRFYWILKKGIVVRDFFRRMQKKK